MGVRPPAKPSSLPAWTTAQIELTILPPVVMPALASATETETPPKPRDLRYTVDLTQVEAALSKEITVTIEQGEAGHLLRAATTGETADFQIQIDEGAFLLRNQDRTVVASTHAPDATRLVALLLHAARYQVLLDLPTLLAPGRLSGTVTLTVAQTGPATKGGPRHKPLPTFGTTAYAPAGKPIYVEVRNDAAEPVNWALLRLAPDYSISLLNASSDRTAKRSPDRGFAQNLEIQLPPGRVQGAEHLLLLASARDVDFAPQALPAFGDGDKQAAAAGAATQWAVLDALLSAAAASPFDAGQTTQEDAWLAVRQSFLVVAPPEHMTIYFKGNRAEFAGFGVTCEVPGTSPVPDTRQRLEEYLDVGPAARILTAEQAAIFAEGGDVLPPVTPPGLAGDGIDPPTLVALPLRSIDGRTQGIGIDLRLPGDQAGKIDDDTPLRIELPVSAHAAAIAVACAGELFVPAGRRAGQGFAVTAWPQAEGFVRLQFYSVTDDTQPMAPGLYAAAFAPYTSTSPQAEPGTRQLTDGMLRYTPATATHLAHGSRVALAVHGYGGGSDAITHWLLTRNAPLGLGYDQVLAFHYDSLDTTLAENAGLLQELLRRAGAGPDDDVQIDLFAHGTGGLLARWLVEVDGGNAIIDRCVLAGTPHDGWHLAASDTYGYWLMLLELNLSHPWRPTLLLQWAAGRNLETGPALAELAPGSEFLRHLATQAGRTAIPYLLLAGNAGRSAQFAALLSLMDEASPPDELGQGDGMTAAASADALMRARRGAANLAVEAVHVTYFHYFADAAVEAAIVRWLRAGESRAA